MKNGKVHIGSFWVNFEHHDLCFYRSNILILFLALDMSISEISSTFLTFVFEKNLAKFLSIFSRELSTFESL